MLSTSTAINRAILSVGSTLTSLLCELVIILKFISAIAPATEVTTGPEAAILNISPVWVKPLSISSALNCEQAYLNLVKIIS